MARRHRRGRLCRGGPARGAHDVVGLPARGRQVLGPSSAAFGDVDALEEGRDDLAQLGEHHVRVPPGFGKWVQAHAQQQQLVGLPGPVDSDVGH